jgi:hypothetical protein
MWMVVWSKGAGGLLKERMRMPKDASDAGRKDEQDRFEEKE